MKPGVLRNKAIRTARNFFAAENIYEVMTAKAVCSPALEPYIDAVAVTGSHTQKELFLATSPEFSLKKHFTDEMSQTPAARGIYEITSVFRDDQPGVNHALEFTMIEWYSKDSSLENILETAARLIAKLGSDLAPETVSPRLEFWDLREIFTRANCAFDFTHEESVIEKYQSLHGSLPYHLNRTDAAIACFNLLFDEYIMPRLRVAPGLTAVTPYPEYLGALAFTQNGIAERAEIFYRGLELANGYREEFRPDAARDLWLRYNTIRRLRGVKEHKIDEELLRRLPGLAGVAGIAVGLERVLMTFMPQVKIADFSS